MNVFHRGRQRTISRLHAKCSIRFLFAVKYHVVGPELAKEVVSSLCLAASFVVLELFHIGAD